MLESLAAAPPDPILSISAEFRVDPREEKLDLGVGVYRDGDGRTPIMEAVKEAERLDWAEQDSKSYLGQIGNEVFNRAMSALVLGDGFEPQRTFAVQAPGGCGALRLHTELIRRLNPEATVWVSDPTWPNHRAIVTASGLAIATYPYYSTENGALLFDEMMATLGRAKPGDAAILHACCHNPTGADLDELQWRALAEVIAARGVLPLVDIAYQGLGGGLIADVAGLRILVSLVDEVLVAASCSKNFGLYRDRVGVAIGTASTPPACDVATGRLGAIARESYSMPPDHGASVVARILTTDELRETWRNELDAMRTRMDANRRSLAETLRTRLNDDRFDFLSDQRGMFSLLGLDSAGVGALRNDHAIYMPANGRINVAGLSESGIEKLSRAMADLRPILGDRHLNGTRRDER